MISLTQMDDDKFVPPPPCGEHLPGEAMGDIRCSLPAGHRYAHRAITGDLTYSWNAGRFKEPAHGNRSPAPSS